MSEPKPVVQRCIFVWNLQDRLGDFEPVDFFVDGKCHFQLITGQGMSRERLFSIFCLQHSGHNGGGKTTPGAELEPEILRLPFSGVVF